MFESLEVLGCLNLKVFVLVKGRDGIDLGESAGGEVGVVGVDVWE